MKRAIMSVVIGVLLVVSGCIPTSINPLYTEKDVVFDAALVGVWSEKDDSKETWEFEKAANKTYKFTYTDNDGKTGQFEVHLLKLGNTTFLDFFPDESGVAEMNRSGYYKIHFLRTHSFMKVLRIEPTLQMAPLDLKWLRELLAKHPKAIRHEKTGGSGDDMQIVLTASTFDLQKFILRHLNTAGAFGDPSNFTRRPSDPKS